MVIRRKIIYTALLLYALSFTTVARASDDKVIAYYFHGSFRCYTCTNMEKYSREAIDNNFKDALTSGKLELKSVNVEERQTEHYVSDYQLYTKTLLLSQVKNDKEVRSKNLDKIWEYARDKNKFMDYVTKETRLFMEEAK